MHQMAQHNNSCQFQGSASLVDFFPPCSLGRWEDFLRHNKRTDVLFRIVMNQMLQWSKKRVSSPGNQRGVAERASNSQLQNTQTRQ